MLSNEVQQENSLPIHYSVAHLMSLEANKEPSKKLYSLQKCRELLLLLLLSSFCLAGADLPYIVQLHLHGDLCG